MNLQLGFSHDINFKIPKDIKVTVEKQTIIKIVGVDKELVSTKSEISKKTITSLNLKPFLRSNKTTFKLSLHLSFVFVLSKMGVHDYFPL